MQTAKLKSAAGCFCCLHWRFAVAAAAALTHPGRSCCCCCSCALLSNTGMTGLMSVYLVDTPQWHSIDFERACHQKQARVQLLEEHTSLALESTSQQNQNGSRLDAGPQLGGVPDNSPLEWLLDIIWNRELCVLFMLIVWPRVQ